MFLLFSLLKYTLNSARLFPRPSQNLSLALTYRTNRFVFYIQTESEFSSHHFFCFTFLCFLYCTPLKICLRSFFPLSFTITFRTLPVRGRGKESSKIVSPSSNLLPSVCKVKFTINYYHYI